MGIIRKQNTQNFPENEHFLPPDTGKWKTNWPVYPFV